MSLEQSSINRVKPSHPALSTAKGRSSDDMEPAASQPNPLAPKNPFAPALQRSATVKPGSAYLPISKSGTPAVKSVPVSPFGLRPVTKK
jgi:hypothetical protein